MIKNVAYFVACMVVIVLFIFLPNFFDIKSSSVYPLPPQNSKTSDSLVPQKVAEASRHIIAVTQITESRNAFNPFLGNNTEAWGTGFSLEPGIFVSAGHVLSIQMTNLAHAGHPISFNRFGIPESVNKSFRYSLTGTTDINGESYDFSLKTAGLGDFRNKYEDIIAMIPVNPPKELKPLKLNTAVLKLDDRVYAGGYVIQKMPLGQVSEPLVLFDVLKKNEPGVIDAVITGLPINAVGVKTLYRINGRLELGYSGGPIFNSDGEVAGMTVLRNQNHVYAISSRDVLDYITYLKSIGAFPKTTG